jgi:hypothetical protein
VTETQEPFRERANRKELAENLFPKHPRSSGTCKGQGEPQRTTKYKHSDKGRQGQCVELLGHRGCSAHRQRAAAVTVCTRVGRGPVTEVLRSRRRHCSRRRDTDSQNFF